MKSKRQLKKDLWKVFARYIKHRDNWTCVTCGKKAQGQAMNAGHYIAKGACGADYYFHEKNTHAQCAGCNLRLEGNRPAYRDFILRTYGEAVLQDLETNYHTPNPTYPYLEKIAYYQEKLKQYGE